MNINSHQLLQSLSPYVRRAMFHKTVGMRLSPRIIFDYELLYIERGELTLRIDHEQFTAGPGELILFKPGIEHEFMDSKGECWMPHIHFDVLYYVDHEEVPVNFKLKKDCNSKETDWIRPDVLGTILDLPDRFLIGNHSEVHKNLMQIIHAYDRRDSEFSILQKSLVLRILYLLIKGLKAADHTHLLVHQGNMERSVTHIMEHYNETIPLEDLSKVACLSMYHFSRIFKQTYGLSPHQFQIRHRMERAKELMMYSRLSLSSIAEQVGYSSIYAFSKAFKSIEGMAPKQYINTYL